MAAREFQSEKVNQVNKLVETTLTSMEVAQMVEKRHADLLKDIRRYVEQLGEGKISQSDFFYRINLH